MVEPINLQLAHWNLEHTAQQQTRDPAAMAAQSARQGEGLAAAEHHDASVQTTDSSAEKERLGRKKRREEEEEDSRRGRGRKGKKAASDVDEEQHAPSPAGNGKLDLYA